MKPERTLPCWPTCLRAMALAAGSALYCTTALAQTLPESHTQPAADSTELLYAATRDSIERFDLRTGQQVNRAIPPPPPPAPHDPAGNPYPIRLSDRHIAPGANGDVIITEVFSYEPRPLHPEYISQITRMTLGTTHELLLVRDHASIEEIDVATDGSIYVATKVADDPATTEIDEGESEGIFTIRPAGELLRVTRPCEVSHTQRWYDPGCEQYMGQLTGVAVTADGRIFASDRWNARGGSSDINGSVYEIDGSSGDLRLVRERLGNAWGLAANNVSCSTGCRLYITNTFQQGPDALAQGAVGEIDPDSGRLLTILDAHTTASGPRPLRLAIRSSGQIDSLITALVSNILTPLPLSEYSLTGSLNRPPLRTLHRDLRNVTSVAIVHEMVTCFSFDFRIAGWYLVSLPVGAQDGLSHLFPTAVAAFGWDFETQSYRPVTQLTSGQGHWLAVSSPSAAELCGPPVASLVRTYQKQGWDLFGATIQPELVKSTPAGAIAGMFSFDPVAGYSSVNPPRVEPGQGYWIAVTNAPATITVGIVNAASER